MLAMNAPGPHSSPLAVCHRESASQPTMRWVTKPTIGW
jgi:hypothetical protein